MIDLYLPIYVCIAIFSGYVKLPEVHFDSPMPVRVCRDGGLPIWGIHWGIHQVKKHTFWPSDRQVPGDHQINPSLPVVYCVLSYEDI